MANRPDKIARAWLTSLSGGMIELGQDWSARRNPPLFVSGGLPGVVVQRVPDYVFGAESTYFVNRKEVIYFFLRLEHYPEIDPELETVYLVGDFNGWGAAIGEAAWALRRATLGRDAVLLWSGPAARFLAAPGARFKFVTAAHRWLPVPATAPNVVRDAGGNLNYGVDPRRTGRHLFSFTLTTPIDLAHTWEVCWGHAGAVEERVPLRPGEFFHALGTDLPLGALVRGEETVFRLFAPRARWVELCVAPTREGLAQPFRYRLVRLPDEATSAGVWELALAGNLHGWFYWYHLEGPKDAYSLFDPAQKVLDPYAQATVQRLGPGIILDPAWVGRAERKFTTPAWHDLVIAEAHVRDLAAGAPLDLSVAERRGFSGLRRWVEHPDFYLHRLGVNCVELQPVQEFDNLTEGEYHWGYMTTDYCAPASAYALDPWRASGVKELQALVAALHTRGIAVILDVVYNHVGEPAHLMFIDRLYYFEQDAAGQLSNWSGCGNDLRARSAMATRLIIDSCRHLLEVYGVDGFRFDLADLIGTPVLRQVETALKRVKPDVILIAEPWSFRGHIAGELRDTGWASWNDGYRNFAREVVRGGGARDTFEYYLKGSPWYYAKWPAQTVNYTESHDDKTWIDNITENLSGNGDHPTLNDRRRTHLMAGFLFMSIGIPMLSSGQDALRSKQGVNNTYQRGDLNALDYRRLLRFPGTHTYFADWISFRLSSSGRLVRHYTRASQGFFRFIWAEQGPAVAVLYNADHSQGLEQLLFAFNPSIFDATVPVPDLAGPEWRQVADQERFFHRLRQPGLGGWGVEPRLFIPALACALWSREV